MYIAGCFLVKIKCLFYLGCYVYCWLFLGQNKVFVLSRLLCIVLAVSW